MGCGVCVYSGQAGSQLLLDSISSGRVRIVRQMHEWDKKTEADAGLRRLCETTSNSACQVHVCLWNAQPMIPPPSGGLTWLKPEYQVTSVGQWNETDLRYGWADWPNNSLGDAFKGTDGRPVTNFPYAWSYNLFNPFNGSARWYLGSAELAMRMSQDPRSQNSGGLTRARGWISACAQYTDIIDLHIYAPDAAAVAGVVAKQILAWDQAWKDIPFFLGECGPHSTHQTKITAEEAAAWTVEVDKVLSATWGDRYRGVCYHGPEHLQMLEFLPN